MALKLALITHLLRYFLVRFVATYFVYVSLPHSSCLASEPLNQVSPVQEKPKEQKKLPKWEAGLASGFFYLPDYPSADESRGRFLALPYAIYRGEILRADREGGLRGRFINLERFEFDVSLGAAFPVNSSDNEARQGMPDLDWVGELGPRMKFFFFKTTTKRFVFRLPVRWAFSTDFSGIDSRGYVINPNFRYRHKDLFLENTTFSTTLDITHASEALMDYFYEVPPQYATSARPAYDAGAGYMGSSLRFSLVKKFLKNNIMLFGGLTLSNYEGVKNAGSPLVREKNTQSYFIGMGWGFYESEELEEIHL